MTAPYDPSTPLRADATDEQILARSTFIFHEGTRPAISIVRELQAATVAEYEAKLAALEFERDDLERVNAEFFDRIEVKREQIAALEAEGRRIDRALRAIDAQVALGIGVVAIGQSENDGSPAIFFPHNDSAMGHGDTVKAALLSLIARLDAARTPSPETTNEG